jgi:hypothetical protein
VERPHYLGLGYGEEEIRTFSKTSEESNASNGQLKSLQEHFTKGDGVSLHDCDRECKSSPKKREDKQDIKTCIMVMIFPILFLIIKNIIM